MCNEWQPIERAPRDGTVIIAGWNNGYVASRWWNEDLRVWDGVGTNDSGGWYDYPTHFLPNVPLPAPPKETE